MGSTLHATSACQGLKDQVDTLHQLQEPLIPNHLASTFTSWYPRKPCLPRERAAAVSAREDPPACRGDVCAQFLLNFSNTVALVCSNSHCWVGEEGLQVFMKILWSLSLQSMQLPLMGWYRVLSLRYFHSWLPFMLWQS